MWSALSTGGWRGEGGNCSCTCPGLSLQVWPRSGRAAAAAWRSQRQPTEEFMALGISSKLLKIPFGIFQLKYMWSSASLCSRSCSFYSSSCHVQQTMQRHATLARYKLLPSSLLHPLQKMQLNAFWSCLACAAHGGDFVLTFAACFGIS